MKKEEHIQAALQEIVDKFPQLEGAKVDFDKVPKIQFKEEPSSEPFQIEGPSPKLMLQQSEVHGYGVFAKEQILAGEQIELSKLLKLGLPNNLIQDPVLKDYVIADYTGPQGPFGGNVYLGLGFICLYNHQDMPNAKAEMDFKRKIIKIEAKRDLAAGEEIFISYGKNYFRFRQLYHNLSEEVKKKLHEIDKNTKDEN